MTFGDIKKTAYAILDEYSKDETLGTEDEDLADKINLIANICYHELSGIKPIKRRVAVDRSSIGTTEYYREYDLPTDMKKLLQIVAFDSDTNKPVSPDYMIEYGVEVVGETTTTYEDKLYINDLSEGDYYIKYIAYPTDLDKDTDDDFELELDRDAQMLMPFAIASDILKSDVSADYTSFKLRYDDQLSKLDIRKSTGLVEVEDNSYVNSFNEF